MNNEIELKFLVDQDHCSKQQIQDNLTDLFSQYHILEKSEHLLINHYFDSDDLVLQRHHCGLRIRQNNDQYQLTMKTAGQSIAGLHQNSEFNLDLNDNILDLEAIPKDFLPSFIADHYQTNDFKACFTTNFQRQQTLLQIDDQSTVEVAFDHGSICTLQGSSSEPIFEIEIELKSGSINSIFQFADDLITIGHLRLGTLSKAARGYDLAYPNHQFISPLKQDLTGLNSTSLNNASEFIFCHLIKQILTLWKNSEQCYSIKPDCCELQRLVTYLDILNHVLILYQQSFSPLPFSHSIDKLISSLQHSMLQQQNKSDNTIINLFYSYDYNKLSLNLTQWLLSNSNK